MHVFRRTDVTESRLTSRPWSTSSALAWQIAWRGSSECDLEESVTHNTLHAAPLLGHDLYADVVNNM